MYVYSSSEIGINIKALLVDFPGSKLLILSIMERCINRCLLQNQSVVCGSYGFFQPITKARVYSATLWSDVPDASLKQTPLRLCSASTAPLRHRHLNKKSNGGTSGTYGQVTRCTPGAQQIVEAENSGSSSTPSQFVPENCSDEIELEITKSVEGTEEVLKVTSTKQNTDELEVPSWIDSGPSLDTSQNGLERQTSTVAHSSRSAKALQSLESRSEELIENNADLEELSNAGCLSEEMTVAEQPSTSRLSSMREDGELQSKGIWQQMKDIVGFAGPALGIWLSPHIMSLINTAVIGNCSSLELAALGPGTVLCDQLSYIFNFLSIATASLIATSLANKNRVEAENHLSRLLLVAMVCGIGMFVMIELCGTSILKAFVGANNSALVPAAKTYVEIRGYAWPAVLIGMVAQSASLGMQDSWSPLRVLGIQSLINLITTILLCAIFRCGLAGAACATAGSQIIGAILMLRSLHHKGYNPLALVIPSVEELLQIICLAGPVLLTLMSKVAFYTVITYMATSLGAITLGAHQVMIGVYSMCTVSGEPLAQTAQSFMPDLISGVNRNIRKAQQLLRSLLFIGTIFGFSLGCISSTMPWFFPQVFTRDTAIINQMRGVTVPFFLSMLITPPTLSLEGTLLAARDLKFLSFSMVSCFCGGCISLMLLKNIGFGLVGSWWILVAFQWARFALAFSRLAYPKSVLRMEEFKTHESKLNLKSA